MKEHNIYMILPLIRVAEKRFLKLPNSICEEHLYGEKITVTR